MSLLATIRRDVALKFTGEVLSRALFLVSSFIWEGEWVWWSSER